MYKRQLLLIPGLLQKNYRTRKPSSPLSCRTVTIGPLVLLGLLGVTFYVGSRPARPRIATLDELSGRTKHKGALAGEGRHVNSTTTEDMSAPLSDTLDGKVGTLGVAQGQAIGEKQMASNVAPSTVRPALTANAQNSWIIHVDHESVPQARRPSLTQSDRVEGPIAVSRSCLLYTSPSPRD